MSHPLIEELSVLCSRQKESGLIGLKSEFESEGVRNSDFTLLSSIAKENGVYSALKIGGAEAKTDMYAAIENQNKYIIVPMVETPYAASKAVQAYRDIVLKNGYSEPKLLFNIETKTAFQNLESILDSIQDQATGIVFGRVDFTLSCGLTRKDIQSEFICSKVLEVSKKCKQRDLEFIVGGAISVESIDFLKEISLVRLDRFETRKCILSSSSLQNPSIKNLLKDCVLFELIWLKFKSQYYSNFAQEDFDRINMLEQRHLYNIQENEKSN